MDTYTCLPLKLDQIETIYSVFMKHDFPRSELKSLSMIRKALARREYECYGLFVDGTLCGYAYLVRQLHDGKTVYLLDYFAITPADRGHGYGSIFLQLLIRRLAHADWLLCEAESPEATRDADERSLRQRRIAFYLRGGLVETGITARVFGVEYAILELPCPNTHTLNAVSETYATIYRNQLPSMLFKSCIAVHSAKGDHTSP